MFCFIIQKELLHVIALKLERRYDDFVPLWALFFMSSHRMVVAWWKAYIWPSLLKLSDRTKPSNPLWTARWDWYFKDSFTLRWRCFQLGHQAGGRRGCVLHHRERQMHREHRRREGGGAVDPWHTELDRPHENAFHPVKTQNASSLLVVKMYLSVWQMRFWE